MRVVARIVIGTRFCRGGGRINPLWSEKSGIWDGSIYTFVGMSEEFPALAVLQHPNGNRALCPYLEDEWSWHEVSAEVVDDFPNAEAVARLKTRIADLERENSLLRAEAECYERALAKANDLNRFSGGDPTRHHPWE